MFYRTYDKRRVRNDNISSEELIVRKYCPQVFSDSNPFKRDVTCAVYSYDGSGTTLWFSIPFLFVSFIQPWDRLQLLVN